MKGIHLALVLAAGLLGGMLSHYVWPQAVNAQVQLPATKEVRSQTFVLVNEKGETQAVFSAEVSASGRTVIKLSDPSGREIWSAGGSQLHPLSSSIR
jgi:hypothetical protein